MVLLVAVQEVKPIQKQPSCKKGVMLKNLGERNCEIKDGSQEMANNKSIIITAWQFLSGYTKNLESVFCWHNLYCIYHVAKTVDLYVCNYVPSQQVE